MKWYKRDSDAALSGMAELTFEERGAYNSLLDLLYSRDGNVPDDDAFCARVFHCRPQMWRRLKAALIAKGKVHETGGKLTANRVETTLKEARNYSESQSFKAKKRWKSKPDECHAGNALTTTTTTTIDSVSKDTGADAPPDPAIAEKELFKRGKEVLGQGAGGLIAKLKKAKGNNVALARAAIEAASTKQNPHEYVGSMIHGPPPATIVSIRSREAVEQGFYAKAGSRQLEAWDKHRGSPYPRDRDGGWMVPAEWPPSIVAASR